MSRPASITAGRAGTRGEGRGQAVRPVTLAGHQILRGARRRTARLLAALGGAAQLQAHQRASAGAGPLIGCHLAVLRPGQLANDVQAKADPAESAAVAGLALHETLEDPLAVGC